MSVASLLASLDERSPAGFAIALHIRFTAPTFLFQTYPKKWIDIYTDRGLVLKDPTVHWGFKNTGSIRWRDLIEEDAAGVMRMSGEYGLHYGFTVGINTHGSRSVSSFARPERDYLDFEIDEISKLLLQLHEQTHGLEALSDADVRALKRMSIRLTHA